MTGPNEPDEPGEGPGSVAEEAARLLEALQGWARESTGPKVADSAGSMAAGVAAGLGARLSDVEQHLATGGQDCTYCPVCRAISLVRQTSPEVRTHLAVAASSLLQAAAGILETRIPPAKPADQDGLQRIDLDETADPPPGFDAE